MFFILLYMDNTDHEILRWVRAEGPDSWRVKKSAEVGGGEQRLSTSTKDMVYFDPQFHRSLRARTSACGDFPVLGPFE